jgi:hypothetical protein
MNDETGQRMARPVTALLFAGATGALLVGDSCLLS